MSTSKDRMRLRIYLAVFCFVLICGTIGFMYAEHLPLIDAIYFTIVTIATVGYGDIAPMTPLGKVLTVALIVTGVGTFVSTLATATEVFLNRRDHQTRQQKLQMVVGLFFSEAGCLMLGHCARADRGEKTLHNVLAISDLWTSRDFERAQRQLARHDFDLQAETLDLEALSERLHNYGPMLVRLMENPYLVEHETFTDLLIATLHLKEELAHRRGYERLPDSDREHLTGDVRRVYRLAAVQWLHYCRHLMDHYPFLYSLAVRTNPFNPDSCPLVQSA